MNLTQDHQIRKTSLFSYHETQGASLIPFAGWMMPVFYRSIIDEHRSVRSSVGIFDLSHMGEIWIIGKDALRLIQKLITNDVRKLFDGKILYSPICNEKGGILDDILVYQRNSETYLCIVNASNIEKDEVWIQKHAEGLDLEVMNESFETGLIGVQGPESSNVLRKIFGPKVHNIPYYQCIETELSGVSILISRTGYTGEDGFELYLKNEDCLDLWQDLLKAGESVNIQPIGLGARDTLRLEMRYPLYGHDISEETSPLEAGLGWTVSFSKEDFMGHQALVQQKAEGVNRKLVGFEMIGKSIPRQDCAIHMNHEHVGQVTSGSFSPSLNKNIGLGYVPVEHSGLGNKIDIVIRGQEHSAKIVKTPFYKGPLNK